VSVRLGGLVPKGRWAVGGKPWLLAVEDPQEPGKDVGSGSYQAVAVRAAFADACDALAAAAEESEATRADEEQAAWAAVQVG
jgi:DNA polymerase sigma